MQRIVVAGSGGAGKSTVAREIGTRLGLPVVHLDQLFWRPGWLETPRDEWAQVVRVMTARQHWVMDGNYSGTVDVRLARADAVVLVDLPRLLCLSRVLRRWWRYRGSARPDMTPGCRERLTWAFVRWIWMYPHRSRPKLLAAVDQAGVPLIRLRSPGAVDRWLATLGGNRVAGVTDIDVLESVLAKDRDLIDSVSPDRLGDRTMCPDYDVHALIDHIVGWARVFAAAANGQAFDGDPIAYSGADPVADFTVIADEMVTGWREGGTKRDVLMTGGEQPAEMVLNMALMEYVAHGCDLALGSGQPVPFTDEELTVALQRGRETLPEQYRGEGMPFGHIIDVPDDAPVLDQFLGFMGRRRPDA
ncbi:MAG: TIGR03086 family metal-binding protein [Pseudonocardiales bacterium]